MRKNNVAYDRQTAFLSSESNKARFVDLLSQHLAKEGHTVKQSKGDADTLIVASGVDASSLKKPVVVVADNTDILVMLLHFSDFGDGDLFMLREARCSGPRKIIQINEISSKVDNAVRENILPIHASGGCDTTSASFGKGKLSALKLVQKSEEASELMTTLAEETATKQEIAVAGCRLFVMHYGGKPTKVYAMQVS